MSNSPDSGEDWGKNMSSVVGNICVACSFDETVISFDYMPDWIGWDPVTQQPIHTIPSDLRDYTHCTGCGTLYSRDGDVDREATRRMRDLMDGRWPRGTAGVSARAWGV